MSATDRRKAMGHIKFFIGTTDTIYYSASLRQMKINIRHWERPWFITLSFWMWITICTSQQSFSQGLFFHLRKRNKTKQKTKQNKKRETLQAFCCCCCCFLSSLLPMTVRGTRSEGQERERNVWIFVRCSYRKEEFTDQKVNILWIQKNAATLFSRSTSEVCIPIFVYSWTYYPQKGDYFNFFIYFKSPI